MNTPMQATAPSGAPALSDLREPRAPRYPWGLPVVATRHLYNDGSLPDAEADVLLVARGGPGEIALTEDGGGQQRRIARFGRPAAVQTPETPRKRLVRR